MHTGHPGDQGPEHPEAGEKSRHEDRLATMPGEERLGALQPLGCDQDVASVAEYKGTPPLAAGPVAHLISHHGAKDAEEDRVPDIQATPLGQNARGEEDGLPRQRNPRTLGHHPE
jgi:hypothetical protein